MWDLNMSNEEKFYTKGEMELLLATNEVKTMQKIMMESFNKHITDDDDHFDRLYKTEKEIISKIDLIPQRMVECSERMKTDVLVIADERYTHDKEFKIFRTKILTGVMAGTVIGTILATVMSLIFAAMRVAH